MSLSTNIQNYFSIILFVALWSLIPNHLQAQDLTASQGTNDAFIKVSWDFPASCFSNGGNPFPNDAFLELKADGITIHSETILQDEPADVVSEFIHQVGPNQTVNYTLTIREIGPGTITCMENAMGNTLAFQPVTAFTVSDGDYPHRVQLDWVNQSSLTSAFSVYRDGQVIANIAATNEVGKAYEFIDSFEVNNLVNGQTYAYCIEIFSQQLAQSMPQQCNDGSTFDMGFTASDNTSPNIVNLQWNDLSPVFPYFDQIKIFRNGSLIKTLAKEADAYLDNQPIYGQRSNYSIGLIRNNETLIIDADQGGVPKNGAIAGKVVTQENLFPLQGVLIRLEGMAGDTLVLDSVATDYAGCFSFPDLYYDVLTDFTLTAKSTTTTFLDNPRTVSLSALQPKQLDLIFQAATSYTEDLNGFEFGNLQTMPIAGADKLDVSWTYTPANGDTTFFNIYRNSDLIARLNDANGALTTFTDLEGLPELRYTYKVVAFRLNGNSVKQVFLEKDTSFLPVAPVTALTAQVNNTLGVIDLSWPAHSSSNFAGFRIERNGALIAVLPVGSTTYTDKTAVPNNITNYSIKTIRIIDGVTYESVGITANPLTTPNLPAALNPTITPLPMEDAMNITWQVPNNLGMDYNYAGFNIYRKETGSITRKRIATKLRAFNAPNSMVSIKDRTGKPNTNYQYEICTFLVTPDSTYEANAVSASGLFPVVKAPENLQANNAQGKVSLTWNAHSSNNHHGFIIYRGVSADSIGQKGLKSTTFNDYINNPPINSNQTYTLRSVRIVEGQRYFSAGITAMGMPVAASSNPELVSNLTATKEVHAHVKICWEYPEFLLSEFKIYRDGQLLDQLPASTRAYFDYAATPGQLHEYSIATTFGANTSQKVYVEGMLASKNRLYGRAYSKENGRGIYGVLITVVDAGNNFYAQSKTDSSGLYEIVNLPSQDGLQLTVTATGDNSDFAAVSPTNISIQNGKYDYLVNFEDNYTAPVLASEAIAEIEDVSGKSNPEIMGITLSWTPSNANYSGFEIYRGLSIIGEISKDEDLIYIDMEGAPSQNYIYRVRAFWDRPTGRVFSEYKGLVINYPGLEPVSNLVATALKEENKVKLSWSHPFDNHTVYFVKRNQTLVAQVATGTSLAYIDTTGLANHLYNYTVTAIKINKAGIFESEERSVELTYPDIYRVDNLTLSVPLDNTNDPKNHVLIEWEYEMEAADGFEVYRDGNLIISLTGDQRNYEDYEGIPGTKHEYILRAFKTKAGTFLLSRPRKDSIIFPDIAPVDFLNVPAHVGIGGIDGFVTYRYKGVDGVFLYRNGVKIRTFNQKITENGIVAFHFIDKEGMPGTNYTYSATAFSVRDGQSYESAPESKMSTFPQIPATTNLQASDGTLFNAVRLTWEYNQEACPYIFEIKRAGMAIDTVDGGQRSFTDVINELGAGNTYNYEVIAIRKVGNIYLESTGNVTDSGYPGNRSIIENEIRNGTVNNGDLGYSVAVDGDRMVVGAPNENNGGGKIYVYEFDGKDWIFKATRDGSGAEQLGFSVDIDGDYIIAGQPGGSAGAPGGFISIFDYDGTTISYNSSPVASTKASDNLGYDVAINGDWAVVGNPMGENSTTGTTFPNTNGKVEVLRRVGGNWQLFTTLFGGPANGENFVQFGEAVDIDGDYIVVGDPEHNEVTISGSKEGLVFIFENINNVWTFHSVIGGSQRQNNDRFGNDVQISGDYIICGAFVDEAPNAPTGSGLAYIFKKNGANWVEESILIGDGQNATSDFGSSVAIHGDYAMVGDSRFASQGKGDAYLFKRNGNSWTQMQKFAAPNGNNGNDYGRSVAISDKHIIVGAPDQSVNGQERGMVYNYLIYSFLESVTATDGAFLNKTTIEWEFEGNQDLINGFNVYRNGELIKSASSTERNYFDTEGIGGLEYLYSVEVEFANGKVGPTICDNGYSLADGEISGTVNTLMGNAPVAGVIVKASATVNNAFYQYETLTGTNGTFLIPNVFYGEANAAYTISVEFDGHEFTPSSMERTLSSSQKEQRNLTFLDKTAYIIKGTMRHEDLVCGYDSIKVTAIMEVTGQDDIVVETFSDEDGMYNLAVNPFQTGLQKIRIEAATERIITSNTSMEKITYDFVPQGANEFTNFTNFPIIQELDFYDQTRYPVAVKVQNTCESPISSDIFTLRVRTLDGCYDKQFDLNNIGEVTLNLPPADLVIVVDDVNNPTLENLIALNYLNVRPAKLDLFTLHVDDDTDEDDAADLTPIQLATLTDRKLTYHKPPTIKINGFQDFFCGDLAQPALVAQNGKYTLNMTVQENFAGSDCNVKEGFIQISNPAGVEADTIILFDKDLGGFPSYTFTAGLPNLIAPHTWALKVEYFSGNGDFLGKLIQPILVTGISNIPGADIIVNPADDPNNPDNYPPLPLFILRDPPGDGSSSTIAKEQTFERTISYQSGGSSGIGAFLDLEMTLATATFKSEGKTTFGGGRENNNSTTFSVTTLQEISTSADETGRAADVIVGVGLAMQYGLAVRIELDEEATIDGCPVINNIISTGFTPAEIATNWVYSVGQIESIVAEYEKTVADIESGMREITDSEGNVLDKKTAAEQFDNLRNNWQQILDYHDNGALPHRILCQADAFGIPDAAALKGGTERIEEIQKWKNAFCDRTDLDGLWSNELITAYNLTINAIRVLGDSLINKNDALEWSFQSDFLTNTAQYESLPNYNEFGIPAKNITFGGGTSLTESFSQTQNSERSIGKFFYNVGELNIGGGIKNDIDIVSPGISIKAVEAENIGGVALEWEASTGSERVTSTEEGVEMSYTLEDADVGDQFSVTIIRSLALNHTPYFQLVGGRSSCPEEEGTIFRDRPNIAILENGAAATSAAAYEIAPAETVTFQLQLSNGNLFGESRDVEVFLDNTSNLGSAIISLGSDQLGTTTVIGIPPGGATVLPLNIQRGLVTYEHNNLRIGVRPLCGGEEHFVNVTVHFQNPCSPITIITPDDNWILNGEENTLIVGVRDYQPENPILEKIKLQYRRTDTGQDWDDVPLRHIRVDLGSTIIDGFDPPPAETTPDFLAAYNATFFGPGETPTYFFVWELPNNLTDYPDGDYEIRAVSDCGSEGSTFSNIIEGKIDRSGLRLFGQPQPADGLWVPGDEIFVSFNQNLNCSLLDDPNFTTDSLYIIDRSNNDASVPFTVVCRDNQLLFTLDNPNLYDGNNLEVIVKGIEDLSGNALPDSIKWAFKVITQQLFWNADTLRFQLYEEEVLDLKVRIENPSSVATINTVSLGAKDGQQDGWISFLPLNAFNVLPSGRSIDFQLRGNQALGTYTETIIVNGLPSGSPPEITFVITIIPRAPNWDVAANNFAGNMNLIANWRFESQGVTDISADTKDQISVWIDNEIRGIANIESAGNGFYASYLSVFGNAEDKGKALRFRVWDADTGTEYDAYPIIDLPFVSDTIIGNTANPQMLIVDQNKDRARYIPLNKGWTWFSINSRLENNSIGNWLSSLTKLTDGDQIKTGDKFAQYVAGTGWLSAGNEALNELTPNEGYLIYLENGPDTLRVAGTLPNLVNNPLKTGWNWVGFPLQNAKTINDAINIFNISNNDLIKTVRQNNTAPFAQYDENNSIWTGSLTDLRPNDAYKINLANPAGGILNYLDGNPFQEGNMPIKAKGRSTPDPMNASTWQLDPLNYQYTLPLIAEVQYNGVTTTNMNDKVAAFIGNELRGVADLEAVNEVNKSLFSFLIGGKAANESFKLYYYNATENQVFEVEDEISLQLGSGELGSTGYGTFKAPYLIDIALFQVTIQKKDVACNADNTGFIEVNPVNAFSPTYQWSHNPQATGNRVEGLTAGTYTVSITDVRNIPVIKTIEIKNLDLPIPIPTVSGAENPICIGTAITLNASSTLSGATFKWFDTNGGLLGTENSLHLTNRQATETIKLVALVDGLCQSGFRNVLIEVNNPGSADFNVDDANPVINTPVTFTPVNTDMTHHYSWDFGDGSTSNDRIPSHTYTTIGAFTVALTITSTANCTVSNVKLNHINTKEQGACGSSATFNGPIASGVYQVQDKITAAGQIASGNNVEFIAGNSITLLPNFHATSGSTFTARIAPCTAVSEEAIAEERHHTSIEETNFMKETFLISPNPSREYAEINFELETAKEIDLRIYNAQGRLVEILVKNKLLEKGKHSVIYKAKNSSFGIFYVTLRKGEIIFSKKLIILR
jgi:hypothetical protein